LVETDPEGNIRRFLEKPKPDEITTNNINAGIYVLEPDTFDRIPSDVAWSIERSYFPSLVERGETFVAYIYDGYWIDIGTPEKYTQVHRDIMDGRFATVPFADRRAPRTAIAPEARVEEGATIEGPCFIDEGVAIKAGARVGPYSVIGRQTQIDEDASIEGAIIWPNCRVGSRAEVRNAIVGRNCHLGRHVSIDGGAVLGDKTTLTDYTRA
jgi:NDP-sugar pyrophosphorylase family protein